MARLQIRRYIWLIDIVRSAGPDGITYEEINRKWHRATLNEDGKDYAWRTFQEDRRIITGEFDIEITCDRRDNTYRIEELDEYGSVRGSLIDALVLNNAIREAPDLNNSIVFNDNFYQECMPGLVRAIKEHRAIRFRYVRQDRIPQLGIPTRGYTELSTGLSHSVPTASITVLFGLQSGRTWQMANCMFMLFTGSLSWSF